MMQLTIYNGSPRGKNSNSSHIINWFLDGYGVNNVKATYYLTKESHRSEALATFDNDDTLLCVFPLYVDGMPGQIKAFFEQLSPYKAQCQQKRIVFIIHSGFSEAIQNRALERYLKRLCAILGISDYTIVILPGSEGFRMMPDNMTKKKHQHVAIIGGDFAAKKPLNKDSVQWLQKMETMSQGYKLLFKFTSIFGLTNMYWNRMLKLNKAYDRRFDAPYKDQPRPITSPKAYWTNR